MIIRKISTNLNAFEIYTIIKNFDESYILDSSTNDEASRYSFMSARPFDSIKLKNNKDSFNILKDKLSKYKIETEDKKFPLISGAVGYLSYNLKDIIEKKLSNKAINDIDMYDMYLNFYDWTIIYDNQNKETYIATYEICKDSKENIECIVKLIENAKKPDLKIKEIQKTLLKSNFKKEEYVEAIERIREYIKAGDVYQVNMTQRFEGETNMDSYDLYNRLRTLSPAPFGAFLNFEDINILSNSPERFIKMQDRKIDTRPIKGTRPRGNDEIEDLRYKEELLNSEKDKAELLMIVDLERNDLGKVSKIGSVKVEELFKLEEYTNVNHLVAKITSILDEDKDEVDLIKASFPGGSITGAPKIRAMDIIEELEMLQRNIYTGSIGYIDFSGDLDLNIAIRTLIKKDNKVYYQVGGGITWDSNPYEEYEESIQKGKSIKRALNGKITI